jgi:hypothetical protein
MITVPPTLTLPHKGGGYKISSPFPLRGEGWGGCVPGSARACGA